MANQAPIFTGTAKSPGLKIENGDGTAEKVLVTAGADGALIQSVTVTSDDTNDVVLQIFINDASTSHLIGSTNIPTLAGTDGIVANVDLLSNIRGLQADGSLILESSHSLRVAPLANVTAAKTVTLVSQGGDL